jgi:hypothetical protein
MNSWDCFDTLIGRYYFEPKSIFNIVAQKINDPSFVKKRIDAEKKSKSKTYEDIYKKLSKYDPSLELETELEYSFPIKYNFDNIKDGDVIVSDMYLSAFQIEKILRHHGLNKDIKVYSSYGGKKDGWMWKKVKGHHNIDFHTGDNIKSDVLSARKHGIKSIYFPGRLITETENFIKTYSNDLCYLMRLIRLLNPYKQNRYLWNHNVGSFLNFCGDEWLEEINGNINFFKLIEHDTNHIILKRKPNVLVKLLNKDSLLSTDNYRYNKLYSGSWYDSLENFSDRDDHRLLWNDQSQYNIPILINISKLLPKNQKFVFCHRDCLYLKYIYDSIYNTNSHMLEVSRKSYRHPFNNDYIKYIIENTKDAIIVDSHGTGKSSSVFFNNMKIERKLIHICLHEAKKHKKNKIFHSYFSSCAKGQHFSCRGRAFEKFNIPYLGALIGFENNRAIRSISEHDKTICDVQFNAIKECCKYIKYFPNIIENSKMLNSLLDMIKKHPYTTRVVKSIIK